MTHRERMLAAVRGEATDRIPWAPRLDLWFRANSLAGTLPRGYRHASLRDFVDDLGWSFHAIVPDFRDLRGPEDDADRALGIYNLRTMPYQTRLDGVRREMRREGDRTHVTYHTPVGRLTTTTVYDEAMRRAGISITHVAEHAFKTAADYAPLGFIFDHALAVPQYDGFRAFDEYVGDRGLPAAFVSLAGSPMHLIQRELMPLDTFFYEMNDHPDEMAELCARIASYWQGVMAVVAEAPATLVFMGANYDASVTYPPFFARHILPTLKAFADTLHARGKFLLTHTDGENTGLLDHYLAAGFDVADSVCPAPMTRLTFRQVREAFASRTTIMGGIPSVALLPQSMPAQEFDAFLDRFFADVGRGERLILGISDTTPPAADFARLQEIARCVEAFGPVRLSCCPPKRPGSKEECHEA